MTTEVVVRRVKSCHSVEEADAICLRIKNGLVHHAASYLMLAELVLEMDESGAWKVYEDDDGGQRYRDVWVCLQNRVLEPLSMSKPVVVAMRRAALAYVQLFQGLEVGKFQEKYPNIPWDEKMNRPVLPMRAMLKLAKLNDVPLLQERAFDLAMRVSNGKLTEKGVAIQVSRLLPGPDVEEDPEITDFAAMAKWLLRVIGSLESNIKAMDEEVPVPKKIVKKLKAVVKDLDDLYAKVKVL